VAVGGSRAQHPVMDLVPRPGATHGVVAPVRTDPTGKDGPTRRQAAGAEWRRSSQGLYVPSYVELTPEQRIVETGAIVPGLGAVTGWGAMRWLGATWFSGTDASGTKRPVPLWCRRRLVRPQALFHLSEERFDPHARSLVDGVMVADAVAALTYEMRHAPTLTAAVQALDMAAYADLVSVAEATEWAHAHPSRVGIERCRRACAAGDENAWSPQETAMRMEWGHDRGRMTLLTNHPVFALDGRHQLTPDLLDARAGVAGEYDGAVHLTTGRRHRDIRREALYRELELELVVMTAPDVRAPEGFQRRLAAAYARVARRPASDRSWTIELPAWWVRTDTVERRRALTESERARWLRRGSAAG